MRRAALVACCGVFALAATACETTQQESAKLARAASRAASGQGLVAAGATNSAAHASDVTLVRSAGRTAVAVKLTDTGSGPQVNVPVLITVKSASGAALYSNDAQGLQASLQEMPLLAPGKPAWWVDDQILVSGVAHSVTVHLGQSHAHAASTLPLVTIQSVQLGSGAGGPYVSAVAVNHSKVAQPNLPVFVVALRGGRVVAAGRGLIPVLPVGAAPKTRVQVYLVGSPKGAQLQLSVTPTAVG
jgi:hypothetical protein